MLPNKDFGVVADVVADDDVSSTCFLLGDSPFDSESRDRGALELCVADPALNMLAKLLVAGCVSCGALGACWPNPEKGVELCGGCARPPVEKMFDGVAGAIMGAPESCVPTLCVSSVDVDLGAPKSDDTGGVPLDVGVLR